MIERGTWLLPTTPLPGGPNVLSRERSRRQCGCLVFVGKRLDNGEAATLIGNCSEEHQALMERFVLALGDSLVNPTQRPLIEVVDEILLGLEEGE